MSRKPLILALLALALSGAAAYYRFVPGRAPVGQMPLESLEPTSFHQRFQAAASETRVLVLVSPT